MRKRKEKKKEKRKEERKGKSETRVIDRTVRSFEIRTKFSTYSINERASLEAMDESAEWRMKYDGQVERSRQLQDELLKV